MQAINKKGSKIFKVVNTVLISIYTVLLILALWNLVGYNVMKVALFILLFYSFNMLFTYKTYNMKFTLPGCITIILSSLAISKVINFEININLFILILLISCVSSIVFTMSIKKYYCED